MSKKGTRALASATLMSLVLTTALSAAPVKAAAGQATRVGEADRYSTAASVATKNWDKAETVVLVNGEGYADAVSGSALAKKLDAPILLTSGNTLTAETKAALTKLGAKKVYVVGGNASVSAALRTELKASYTVTELGGANRYETNAAVAEELVKLGVDPANVMMVGGEGFSDALSVAPIAAAKGQILLLGMNDANYMSPVIDFVKKHKSKVTVVGTKGVISEAIYNAVGATSRVDGGADRWDTNQKVLASFKDTVKFDKLYVASAAYNAKDNGFADALVASALAGKYAAPLVLVDKDGSTGTNNALAYIGKNASKKTDLNVVGGTGVVSESVLNAITKAVNPEKPGTNGDNKVAEINSINLNQFDIVFDSNVDEDTAELTSNYKVGGTQLTDKNAHVELINDNTVRVTLVKSEFSIDQGNEKTVSVKKGILTADKTQTIATFDKKIEFKDVTAPEIKEISVRGNSKLVLKFTEAVNMSSVSTLKSLIQVNDKSLSNVEVEVKESASNGTETWASEVEFYFSSGLKSGENTIKVKDAKDKVLVDAAGFAFKEAEETVTVDNVTTEPEIKDITCTDDGEVRVIFDRAMDKKTAIKDDYYQINDKDIDGAKLELKEDDTVVKITNIPADVLKDNTNVLSITDSVKDAFGNKIDDDTRKSFDKEKDETKPTVLSATVIDNKTLRVQFSEDVKYAYATDKDNYELRDAYNVDLMGKSGVYVRPSSDVDYKDKADTDTFDIKFDKSSYKLDSSKYTLTVENIIDKATEPNKMDDQTITIDGNDDTAPSVEDLDVFQKSSTEVAIYFGKEMDASTLNDKANYYYINGDGEQEDLPEDADIDVSNDNKGVVIDFEDANKTIKTDATSGDDVVKKIGVKNVKDASGNEMFPGVLSIKAASATGPKLEENTLKMKKDGDDVKAEFQLDVALDTINPADFKISGRQADDADFDGKTVTLTFDEGDSADAIMALGVNAELQIKASSTEPSEDIAGRKIVAGTQKVYYNEIAPETDRDNYSATVTVDAAGKVTSASVNITLKTPVDTDILGSYKDDFVFTSGSKLDVADVKLIKADGRPTLVFKLKDASKVELGGSIDITAATDEDDIDLRTAKDENGKTVKFVPSSDDTKIKKVKVTKGELTEDPNTPNPATEIKVVSASYDAFGFVTVKVNDVTAVDKVYVDGNVKDIPAGFIDKTNNTIKVSCDEYVKIELADKDGKKVTAYNVAAPGATLTATYNKYTNLTQSASITVNDSALVDKVEVNGNVVDAASIVKDASDKTILIIKNLADEPTSIKLTAKDGKVVTVK
ncbi:cell wall-binding repeat-containing protein [Clostridium sp. A1-XYC3]|uniref:Cell wall-binding repeat-containing protein n=1 Tax=Clostridium tanneri TaxID=3037988 RepID=A0ABU4JWP1_9CLOT|nr:cell wall-binding repeat-containing protein [Clostridium sp. A1-XYC3]MDW8802570.1 cell wall-binding repeat-containing protein [Clostridium sp. A1-XYC3]